MFIVTAISERVGRLESDRIDLEQAESLAKELVTMPNIDADSIEIRHVTT